MISYMGTNELNEAMNSSDLILSRSGYSTIMDLAVIGKKAILVPTPGQTEQEYLAEELKEKKIFYSEKQNDFSLQRAIENSKDYTGFFQKNESNELLSNNIQAMLLKIK